MSTASREAFVIENGVLTAFTDQAATVAVIPDGVTKVGLWAFSGCTALEEIIIPDTVVEIGYEAFRGCSSLRRVTLPGGLKAIGDFAFAGCHRLTDLVIPQGLSLIGNRAFSNRKGRNLAAVPIDMAEIGRGDANSFTPVAKLGDFLIHDGALLQYFGAEPHVAIPDGITVVKGHAFAGCGTLRSVTVPDSVEYIHDLAFSGCLNLASVSLPQHIISFGQGVFSNCPALRDINFFGSQSPALFSGCTGLTGLILPDSVLSVSSNSYDGCRGLRRLVAMEATEIARSWGFWANSAGEAIGSPTTAVIAPRVPLDQVEGIPIKINCILGYFAAPELYAKEQAARYESCLDTQRGALLAAGCEQGVTALVRWYCDRRKVSAGQIGALVEAAQRGGHIEIVALLLEYRHARHTPGEITRQAEMDIARLLAD